MSSIITCKEPVEGRTNLKWWTPTELAKFQMLVLNVSLNERVAGALGRSCAGLRQMANIGYASHWDSISTISTIIWLSHGFLIP